MKRRFRTVLSITLCLIMILGNVAVGGEGFAEVLDMLSVKVSAADSGYCGDNVTYSLDTDIGLLTISGTGSMYNYNYFGSNASPWCSSSASIKNVVINDSVTSIGKDAFYNCTNLKSISIGNGVSSIGECSFYNCTALESITIPDSVKSIGGAAFRLCSGLSSIALGNGVTSIGDTVFYDCAGLENIIIPDSVISIGNDAFHYCTGLKSITFGKNVTCMGDAVFYNCTGLTSVVVPGSITKIGVEEFYNCTALKTVIIGNGITSIGNHAFRLCNNLESINIPDGVTSIGEDSFYGCYSLKKVNYTGTIGQWCEISFSNDESNPLRYARKLYINDESVQEAVIPDSVTEIKKYAFYNCTCLESITIPDSVTSIGDAAFYKCTSLFEVNYTGSEEDKEEIAIGINNECLENINWSFIPKHTHNYEETYNWSADGKTCSATAICQNDNTHVITENATVTSKVKIPATCEEKGTTTYTATFSDNVFSTQTKDIEDIDALNHEYYRNSYIWSADYSTCTARAECKHDSKHIVTEEGVISSGIVPGNSCDDIYRIVYSATFTNRVFNDQVYTVYSNKPLGHSFTNYVFDNNAMIGVDGTETAKCDRCTATDTKTKVGSAKAAPECSIKNMSKYNGHTVDYKTSLTIYADVHNCTDLKWFVTGAKFTTNDDGSVTIKQAKENFSVYFTAKDLDGNEVKSETESVKVDTGFFAKLAAFFKGLFKSLPELEQ